MAVVRRGLGGAERLVRNPKELLGILSTAERALERLPGNAFTPLVRDTRTLLRLLRAYALGEYRRVSGRKVALALAALLYLASPLDVIPDILPGGFADDAAVIGFVLRALRSELAAFEAWERTSLPERRLGPAPPGQGEGRRQGAQET